MFSRGLDLPRKQSYAWQGASHKRGSSTAYAAYGTSATHFPAQALGKNKDASGRRFYAEVMPPPPPPPSLPPPLPSRSLPPPPLLSADHLMERLCIGTGEIIEQSPEPAQREENKLLRVFRRRVMAKKEMATTCDNSRSNNRRSLNAAEAGSGGWWDDASSDRSTVSGATLVGSRSAYSTTYGYGARPAAGQPSSVCSVDLEQHPAFAEHWQSSRLACGSSCTSQGGDSSGYGHFLQMRGCIPERSVSVRGKGDEFGSGAGVLRFVLSPHATFSGILEIIDCEDMGVAYRKISRDGRSWCETFHKVPIQAYAGACNAMAPASFSSVDGRWAALHPALPRASSSSQTSTSTLVSMCGSQDYRQYRHQQQLKQRHPQTFELNQLWEMSSPCPTSFPLHCRDTRGIIDPIPMTALVADRLRFCYRFHLAGNKLKW
ncbi:hypothetical protein GGF44_002224, partial [Coemansia sp. RSA 1694]